MTDALKLWEQFYREFFDGSNRPAMLSRTLTDLEYARPVLFGDALYLAPAGFQTDGIRILRAGLHLGTVCRGRFEPSHALAMALEKEGDVSEPVLTSYGIHLILHGGDLASGPVPLEAVRENLEAAALDEARQAAYSEAVEAANGDGLARHDEFQRRGGGRHLGRAIEEFA